MAQSAEVLAQLRDQRLPALSEWNTLADLTAGCALGLLAAMLVVLLARALVRRPPSARALALADLTASRQLQPAERLLAQAKILQRLAARSKGRPGSRAAGGEWSLQRGRSSMAAFLSNGPAAGLNEALYRPDPGIDLDRLEQELGRLLKRVKGRDPW